MKKLVPALLALLIAGCAGGGAVVTVNGQAIGKDQFDNQLEGSSMAPQILQRLVQNALIDQYAQQHNITIPDSQIDKIENQYKARLGGQWDQMLKAQGLTEADVRNLIRRQLVIDKAVGSNINVSEKQISDYFNKNRAQFDQPAQARARHILVGDLKTAQKVEADLKGGKDFAAEAKQYSQDPGSKNSGGELGWFGKGRMAPPFDKYVFSGKIGAISPPVKSFFGYHIIQVEDRKPAQKATLASAHDQVAQLLRGQQEAPLIQPFLQQLQQSAKITVNDPRFAAMFATPPPFSPAPAPAATPTK